jgi:GNAT superfamily N-acetyltransferase
MSPPPVRRAGPRDAERVTRLWLALGEHQAPFDPAFAQRRDEAAWDAARGVIDRLLADPDAALFLAEREGAPVALCIVRAARAPAVAVERERAEISDLFVEASARRQGLGRVLVDHAMGWVRERDIPRVTVRVANANPEGQAFWRALGFGELVDVLSRRV